MIICPNCNHQNPAGAVQCEACYTPLPSMLDCPKCGASIQSDASFCGHCGANLTTLATHSTESEPASLTPSNISSSLDTSSEPVIVGQPSRLEPDLSAPASIPDLDLQEIHIPNLSAPLGSPIPDPFVASV
ncbi:MAG: zinc ribbon domain-containing protein, partial [Merismopedia sp. SIO2A8]|nr:zinc ribbon domain-containing protein [Merismopedia sp. SIO2A8]